MASKRDLGWALLRCLNWIPRSRPASRNRPAPSSRPSQSLAASLGEHAPAASNGRREPIPPPPPPPHTHTHMLADRPLHSQRRDAGRDCISLATSLPSVCPMAERTCCLAEHTGRTTPSPYQCPSLPHRRPPCHRSAPQRGCVCRHSGLRQSAPSPGMAVSKSDTLVIVRQRREQNHINLGPSPCST